MRTFTAELGGSLFAGAASGGFMIGLMGRFAIHVLEQAGLSPSLLLGLSFLEFVGVGAVMGVLIGFLYPFLILRLPKPFKLPAMALIGYVGTAYMLSTYATMVMNNLGAYWPTAVGFAIVFLMFASLFLKLQDYAATAFSSSGAG